MAVKHVTWASSNNLCILHWDYRTLFGLTNSNRRYLGCQIHFSSWDISSPIWFLVYQTRKTTTKKHCIVTSQSIATENATNDSTFRDNLAPNRGQEQKFHLPQSFSSGWCWQKPLLVCRLQRGFLYELTLRVWLWCWCYLVNYKATSFKAAVLISQPWLQFPHTCQ